MAMTLPEDIGMVMVKSYFEKEITAYLMFIISGPQKVFLFLKHIRNTNSSYRSQLLRFHFQIQCVDISRYLQHLSSNKFEFHKIIFVWVSIN